MAKTLHSAIKYFLVSLLLLAAALAGVHFSQNPSKASAATTASSTNPCVSAPAPAQWQHVVVLMFENKTYSSVIGSSSAPYITNLANQCGTAYSGTSGAIPKNNWHDANYKVDGTTDGNYVSKPSYATLTSGVPPSVHGLTDDNYSTTTGVDNIYNQLNRAGKSFKDYYSAGAGGCGVNFSGGYHDPIRYFTNVASICSAHDVPLSTFMTDVNSGTLPAFSFILPTNSENMHDNSVSSGDTWAQNFLTPLLDSAQYKSGDTAVFFLWDEDTAIPNVLLAPSVVAGSKVPVPSGNPISHFAGLRTWEDMLGLPLIGNTSLAPSLSSFFGGSGPPPPPPTDNPPAVNLTAPANGATITTSPATVSANATDDLGVAKVEFYDGTALINTDTSAPYSANWNTAALSGSHTLTAKAYDTGGHVTTSGVVTVTVSITPGCQNTPANTLGSATTIVSLPAQGTYHIWSRIMAPDTTNNSYYIQIDTGCPTLVGDASSIAANSWIWVDYQDGNTASHTSSSLASGNHTITMIGREAGVKLDRVLLLSDTCTPSGTGDNCIDSTAPIVSISAPVNAQIVSGPVSIKATANDNTGGTGVTKVDFLVDGNVVGTSTVSPYQLSWNSTTVPDGSHTVQAKATDAAGNVGASSTITVTVQNADIIPPTAPSNLTATKVVYNEVDLSWTASTDNVKVTGYLVKRNGITVATTTDTTYSDTSVSANTVYTYTVIAVDAVGNQSPSSNSLPVTTPSPPDIQPPTAPSSLTAVPKSATQVDLSWQASTDNVGVVAYYVARNGSVIGAAPGSDTTYSDTTASPATTYSYIIVAVDAAGNASSNSNAALAITPPLPDTQAPSAPSNLAGFAESSTQVNLTWTASTDNVGVTGYDVYRNGQKIGSATTTSFGDATAAAGQTYTYYVVAFDAAGNRSPNSNEVSVVTPPLPPSLQTIILQPADDATIHQNYPKRNFNKAKRLNIKAKTKAAANFLIKFNVSGINGRLVTSAKLQLYVRDGSDNGGNYHSTSNSWSESTLNWNNAPAASSATLASLGRVARRHYVQVDLSNYITQDGTYSMRVDTPSTNNAVYTSRETAHPPQLVITVQ